ncbi:hypothetical protein OB905_02280 [Halobacteria archaeon AArc-dxtr1]|nr:hypothetical protein [Halobacteria archaeon AArc-dxtr1]
MATNRPGIDLASLGPLHWVGVVLALVSAAVHLVLGIGFLPHWMGVLFLLATGGFLGAIVLLLVNYRRRLLYLVGIPFVGVQLVGWYAVNEPTALGAISTIEVVDKVAQLLLLAILVVLYRRETV